jgi:hypothetical protein
MEVQLVSRQKRFAVDEEKWFRAIVVGNRPQSPRRRFERQQFLGKWKGHSR